MMLFSSKHVLIPVLILMIARIPIPWVHSHDWMSPYELREHLVTHHGCGGSDPEDLHFHMVCWWSLTASEDGVSLPNSTVPVEVYPEQVSLVPRETHHTGMVHGNAEDVAFHLLLPTEPEAALVSPHFAVSVQVRTRAERTVYLI